MWHGRGDALNLDAMTSWNNWVFCVLFGRYILNEDSNPYVAAILFKTSICRSLEFLETRSRDRVCSLT
jgi:hypothetical protein